MKTAVALVLLTTTAYAGENCRKWDDVIQTLQRKYLDQQKKHEDWTYTAAALRMYIANTNKCNAARQAHEEEMTRAIAAAARSLRSNCQDTQPPPVNVSELADVPTLK